MTVSLVANNGAARSWMGLASDTKPSALPSNDVGGYFDELDTGRRYRWTGSAWSRLFTPQLPAVAPAYFFQIPSQVHVAVANTIHWDLFNADSTLVVRVLSVLQIPDITQAVTGVAFSWLLERSTAVGTGGGALTAWLADTNFAALSANITARSKPTGGAGQGTDLYSFQISSEETDAGVLAIAARGGLELVPELLRPVNGGVGIVLRPSTGLRMTQVTNSAAGNTGWLIGFTVE